MGQENSSWPEEFGRTEEARSEEREAGAFAFAWFGQNYERASCKVVSTSDRGVRSIETERGIVGAGETIAGSPHDSWLDAGGAKESDGDASQAGGSSAARAQEAPGVDDGRFGFGAFAARTNQRTSMAKTLVGVTGLWSDQWRHDLEMRLQWLNWIFDSRIGQVLS